MKPQISAGLAPVPGGGQIAYEIQGTSEGTPVLLVRPLGGTMNLWGRFRDILAERFRVIAFDARGNGRSSPPRLGITTRAMAADALALLDHLGVARAHLFGISLGGMVSTWLAADAPDRVARLCLAAAPARGATVSLAGARRLAGLARCLLLPAGEVEACIARGILSEEFRQRAPEEVARVERIIREEPARRGDLLQLALAAALHDARGALGRIRAPTLVLTGERDTLLARRGAEAVAQGIAGARIEALAGTCHDLVLEHPAIVGERVATFFTAAA